MQRRLATGAKVRWENRGRIVGVDAQVVGVKRRPGGRGMSGGGHLFLFFPPSLGQSESCFFFPATSQIQRAK